ncbi:hypothetical protein PR048_022118 [Dryococelus australis]|uniref:Uncharacterized protein n=1 Tax=Dryococelus australis TaxID=614101 RepID=A0ABQ9H052_9NEOP|nr:hypothetical protein PR048_022118 [Dryococelus australis]
MNEIKLQKTFGNVGLSSFRIPKQKRKRKGTEEQQNVESAGCKQDFTTNIQKCNTVKLSTEETIPEHTRKKPKLCTTGFTSSSSSKRDGAVSNNKQTAEMKNSILSREENSFMFLSSDLKAFCFFLLHIIPDFEKVNILLQTCKKVNILLQTCKKKVNILLQTAVPKIHILRELLEGLLKGLLRKFLKPSVFKSDAFLDR